MLDENENTLSGLTQSKACGKVAKKGKFPYEITRYIFYTLRLAEKQSFPSFLFFDYVKFEEDISPNHKYNQTSVCKMMA